MLWTENMVTLSRQCCRVPSSATNLRWYLVQADRFVSELSYGDGKYHTVFIIKRRSAGLYMRNENHFRIQFEL